MWWPPVHRPTELGRDVPMAKKEWWPIGYFEGNHPPLFSFKVVPIPWYVLPDGRFCEEDEGSGATVCICSWNVSVTEPPRR
jgi:hypothetical protein